MLTDHTYTSDHYIVSYQVRPGEDGIRLDSYLKKLYRKRSREAIQRAIDEGSVVIRRQQSPHLHLGKIRASSQVITGDEILVTSIRKTEPTVSFDYRILFEDTDLLIIDKPPNLPVHPAGRYFFNTLLTHLRTHGHRTPLPGAQDHRPEDYFLVHRIDKETSGILVMARNARACAALVYQFATRKTAKRYLAITHGTTQEAFSNDRGIIRDAKSAIGLKMRAADTAQEPEAQAAFTEFRRLSVHQGGAYSLVECLPRTGRQHQIRVHLDDLGHGIVGDKLYGLPEGSSLPFFERGIPTPEAMARLKLPRHALHAAGIGFLHPTTGKELTFDSPLPTDLEEFLK
ncbi:MAG: RluA family pseudouridine synthase [Bdellovibrionota bacterium]